MVLPLIGSFLASSFAPAIAGATGLSFLANPLVAGAFGSGIGSLLQGDDFDEAVANGMMSFMGGKLLGGLSNSVSPVATGAGANVQGGQIVPDGMELLGQQGGFVPQAVVPEGYMASQQGLFDKGIGSGIQSALKQGASVAAANPMMAAGVAGGSLLQDAMSPQDVQEEEREPYVPTETQPFPQNPQFPTMGYQPGVSPEFNYGFYNPSAGQLQTKVLYGGGLVEEAPSFGGGSMFGGDPMFRGLQRDLRQAIKQNTNEQIGPFVEEVSDMAQERFGIGGKDAMKPDFGAFATLSPSDKFLGRPAAFRTPEIEQKLKSFQSPSMMGMSAKLAGGGLAALAEGGDVEDAMEMPNEKEVIVNAVNAVKGNMDEEQASLVLAQFVQTYGEEALADLVEDVRNGEYDNIGGKADGMIDGGGDGMSDSVPATIDGQEDLLVSKDEYVIDAPTVAMIGNGSSDAGAEKLDNMREEVRKAATGSRVQPKKIDAEGIMSLALAS